MEDRFEIFQVERMFLKNIQSKVGVIIASKQTGRIELNVVGLDGCIIE